MTTNTPCSLSETSSPTHPILPLLCFIFHLLPPNPPLLCFIFHLLPFILHPYFITSSFSLSYQSLLHPSTFVLHPSSFILHPPSFIPHYRLASGSSVGSTQEQRAGRRPSAHLHQVPPSSITSCPSPCVPLLYTSPITYTLYYIHPPLHTLLLVLLLILPILHLLLLFLVLVRSSFFPSSADLLHAKPPPLNRKPAATTNTPGHGLGQGSGQGQGQDDNEGTSAAASTKAVAVAHMGVGVGVPA